MTEPNCGELFWTQESQPSTLQVTNKRVWKTLNNPCLPPICDKLWILSVWQVLAVRGFSGTWSWPQNSHWCFLKPHICDRLYCAFSTWPPKKWATPPKRSCPHPQIYTAVRGIFVLISASWHRNLTSMVSLVTQTQCPGPKSQLLGWWGADSRTKIFHQNCMLDPKHHVPTQLIEARHSRLPKRNDFQS